MHLTTSRQTTSKFCSTQAGETPNHGQRGHADTYDLGCDVAESQQDPRLGHVPASVSGHGLFQDGEASSSAYGAQAEDSRPSLLPRASSICRRLSLVGGEDTPPPETDAKRERKKQVAWKDLPNKTQLAILTLARLSEPLTQTSLRAYMFYQVKSFDPSLPDSTVASQVGILEGSFAAAQFLTAILWGRVSDSHWFGRKRVILIGLSGTCLSCVGFGFSRSFWQATMFRAMGGALNGNVGVMKTMISEIIREKKFQSRAFLLLPMCFNIGVIIGPLLGGVLADPVASYPRLFGDDSLFGESKGVSWLKRWPYALPNLMSAVFLFAATFNVFFGLEETLESLRGRPDVGLLIGRSIACLFRSAFRPRLRYYTALSTDDTLDTPITPDTPLQAYPSRTLDPEALTVPQHKLPPRFKRKLPFRRIFTRNVLCTLLTHFLVAFHIGTFNNLWFIFLSTPRFDPSHPIPPSHTSQSLPFNFTGGLGMSPITIGLAMTILGAIGIVLQLVIYPRVIARVGTLRSFRLALLLFPITYCLAPYLAMISSTSSAPHQASGPLVWATLALVMFLQVLARTFALPSLAILVNNCSPHPSVLGTVHGIAQSGSSASRTIGPVLGGWGLGLGLKKGVVGGIWWALAGCAGVAWMASGLIYEGDGHEILLDGEKMGKEEARER